MKIIIKNQNALYVKMIVKPNLEKLYKKCLCIICMNQNKKISQSRKNQIIRDIQQQQSNKEGMI